MRGSLIDWGAACGAYLRDATGDNASPPQRRAPGVSRGAARPALVAGTRPQTAAPAGAVDLVDLDDEPAPAPAVAAPAPGDGGDREQTIRELIDLLGPDDPIALTDALADLDRATPALRGGSITNRIEGRAEAIRRAWADRGRDIDPGTVTELARSAVAWSSGWRESAPGGSVALAER